MEWWMGSELIGNSKIDWVRPSGTPNGFETIDVITGQQGAAGSAAIEIASARWTKSGDPTREALARLHTLRVNQRVTPVILVVEFTNGNVVLFGPNLAVAPTRALPADQAERILQAVLDEPNPIAASNRYSSLLPSLDSTSIPGIKNSGLFANHELKNGVPRRSDWASSCERSVALLRERDHELIGHLGYATASAGANALLLTGKGPRPEAIAVMLEDSETFDANSQRFSVSPVAYGLKMAEQEGVPWLILARRAQLRLYPARIDLGVGRKGLAETYLEVDLPQLTRETAGYLTLIFSAPALAEGGSAFEIMHASAIYAVGLGARLRNKVYEDIVPRLSLAAAKQLVKLGYKMDAEGLDLAYQLTLRIFFRMLFQTYAEDRNLLPFGENARYDRNALKTMALDLVEEPDQPFDPESSSLWEDLTQVWHVIDKGDKAWGVPAYNGGLFASDPVLNEHGAIIERMSISNDVLGPCLRALLLDEGEDHEFGPIDFRSLSVREFGTIYEGLLESSLGLAEVDLTLDGDGTWLPVKTDEKVEAVAGEVYFHNTSGQRKGTGSYYTPTFVVEHLLERSLDPALSDHLAKVAELIKHEDQAGAADLFFDFRVVDLAMGSGHFLTAAIDHIERKMAAFLEEDGHQIPDVTKEIILLGNAARNAVGDQDGPVPEGSSLLRRQIARRCIYGLDINPISVELARVAIWIHTFVRGLPMSSLDHNLVCANSLTGIGSIDEALDVLVPGRNGAGTFFDGPIEDALRSAQSVLAAVALMPEVDRGETQAATRAIKSAQVKANSARLLFDAAVLIRIGRSDLITGLDSKTIVEEASTPEFREVVRSLKPGHLPALFPEVFLRKNGGFDVVVGNPPWKQLMVDELRFWLRAEPGIMALKPKELKERVEQLKSERSDLIPAFEAEVKEFDLLRDAVTTGPFPGAGGGGRAPDLYLAFAWRNWQLVRDGGRMGLVFPRTLLSAAVSSQWREEVLANGSISVVTVTNSGQWVFEGVDGRYSIALVTMIKDANCTKEVGLSGPFYDIDSFERGRNIVGFVPSALLSLSAPGAPFPQLPDTKSTEVFRVLRESPRLPDGVGSARFTPVYEFNATTDRPTFDAGGATPGRWPVLGGASFNLWDPDAGEPYAWADPDKVISKLQAKRLNQIRLRSSAFYGMDQKWARNPDTLPCHYPRIVFRDVTNATNTRTCIASLLPGDRVLVNQAPYLLRVGGTESDEAFLLGVLSSIPLDWYARRYVELHLNFQILNGLPIPNPLPTDLTRLRVIEIAGRLAAKDERFENWATAVGVPVGSVTSADQQSHLEAELDALIAHLYGLNRSQIEHVFETFHRGWDFHPRLTKVLDYFDRIEERS
jgi:hypothetical protein